MLVVSFLFVGSGSKLRFDFFCSVARRRHRCMHTPCASPCINRFGDMINDSRVMGISERRHQRNRRTERKWNGNERSATRLSHFSLWETKKSKKNTRGPIRSNLCRYLSELILKKREKSFYFRYH